MTALFFVTRGRSLVEAFLVTLARIKKMIKTTIAAIILGIDFGSGLFSSIRNCFGLIPVNRKIGRCWEGLRRVVQESYIPAF